MNITEQLLIYKVYLNTTMLIFCVYVPLIWAELPEINVMAGTSIWMN